MSVARRRGSVTVARSCAAHVQRRQELVATRTVFYGKLQRLLPAFITPTTPESVLPALQLLLDTQASAAEVAGYIHTQTFYRARMSYGWAEAQHRKGSCSLWEESGNKNTTYLHRFLASISTCVNPKPGVMRR